MHRFTAEGDAKNQPSTQPLPQGQAPPKVGGHEVHVQNDSWTAAAEARLRIEREATEKMRADMTKSVNGRTGEAKEGVLNNCKMAANLTGLLKGNPELLQAGGLFSRIVGTLEGQGQHDVDKENPDPQVVIDNIGSASTRVARGRGEGDDANKVLQFIGCFVDGLTEVNEGQPTAVKQFDKVWPGFRDAFGLQDSDKEKLLARVDGYKEIAGAAADTLSGKGKRKGDTRVGVMPNDPRYKIGDENALIKGDISGSMHSQLLAQELAESLLGGKGIKDKGDPVVVKNKSVLDARAVDALALTAGGKAGPTDVVFHTAYEMINGMRAITGAPEVSQPIATEVMDRMLKGKSFTDAMEEFFGPAELPWLAEA